MDQDFRSRLKQAAATADIAARVQALRALATTSIGLVETVQLDRALAALAQDEVEPHLRRLRVALLSSATIAHLMPALRVAGLRHGLSIDVLAGGFDQYRQELRQPTRALLEFAPEVVVLSLSARGVVRSVPLDANAHQAERVLQAELAELRSLWQSARNAFGAAVVQQTYLDVFEPVFGSFDRMAGGAPASLVQRLNDLLARAAREEGVALLDVARASARDGLDAWFDTARWLQGKMEIAPQAAGRFGELAARVLIAQQGRSRKCVVFDLDHTLWGGVVGDVGIEGLVLGEGSAAGEAHLELQRYALRLKARGVILAVCSKNDAALAEDAFARHPEMALRREDIACFVANWQDKAENLRHIAHTLNIGLDSLVFVDDNPAERARVRGALPMVAVPELPEDPALYVRALATQGYFEAVSFTQEDAQRAASYTANAQREALRESASSMDDFLRGLEMVVSDGEVTPLTLERSVQLLNKTNQFNATGRRYTAEELSRIATGSRDMALQFRLADRLGDSGLVSVMVLRAGDTGTRELEIENWVMSCRVFGRQLEDEILNIVVERARARGTQALRARFVPTERNGVIGRLFADLGFRPVGDDTAPSWRLDLQAYKPRTTHIRRGSARS